MSVARTLDELLRSLARRVTLIERRLALRSSGGGGGTTLPPFPAPVRYADGATHVIAATAWGTILPGTTPVQVTTTRPLWVLVTLGAWMQISAGSQRVGFSASGATVLSPPPNQQGGLVGSGALGQVLYADANDFGNTAGATGQRTAQRLVLLNAGTTTFQIEAYLATAGTHNVNYPVLEITPLWYDTEAVAAPTVQGVITRRTIAVNQTIAAAGVDQLIAWDQAVAASGHFTFTAPGSFVCAIPGSYTVNLSVGFGQATSASGWSAAKLFLNGTVVMESLADRDTPGGRATNGVITLQLAAGDVLTAMGASRFAESSFTNVPSRTFIELIPVTVDSDTTPLPAGPRVATGTTAALGVINIDASATVAIVFPVGLFTQPPIVSAICSNGRVTISYETAGLTKDGVTLRANNWSSGNMPAGALIQWTAIQT